MQLAGYDSGCYFAIPESGGQGIAGFKLAFVADEVPVFIQRECVAFGESRLGVRIFDFFADELKL